MAEIAADAGAHTGGHADPARARFATIIVGVARGESAPDHVPLASIAALVYLIVAGSLIAFSAFTYLLRNTRPALATSYAYVNPIVALLLGVSVAAPRSVADSDADPVTRIDGVGFQWSWQFVYPDEDVTVTGGPGEPPEMVLPLDEPVELDLVSSDVNHSFWVPDFLSKRDLIQGIDNEITVTATEPGTYTGRCAEFCGLDHWRMYFSVRVVPADEFERWLDEHRADGGAR